jgi:hypothetical protein
MGKLFCVSASGVASVMPTNIQINFQADAAGMYETDDEMAQGCQYRNVDGQARPI